MSGRRQEAAAVRASRDAAFVCAAVELWGFVFASWPLARDGPQLSPTNRALRVAGVVAHVVLGFAGSSWLDPSLRARRLRAGYGDGGMGAPLDSDTGGRAPSPVPLICYLVFLVVRLGQALFWWWLPYSLGVVSNDRLLHWVHEYAGSTTVLPSLHGFRHVIPPVAETVYIVALCYALYRAHCAFVLSPHSTPEYTLLFWLGGFVAVGYVFYEGVVLGHGSTCTRCEYGFSYAKVATYSETTCLAFVAAILVPLLVTIGAINLFTTKPYLYGGEDDDKDDDYHVKRG